MNFVFVSLQRINTDRDSTSTSLAKELAKNHKVLYVNSPIDRKTLHSAKKDKFTQAHIDNIRKKGNSILLLQDNLWVLNPPTIIESINWIPFTSIFQIFNRINNSRIANDIKQAVEHLKFKSFILINDKDIFRGYFLKELLKPEKYLYLDRDYTLGIDYWRKHGLGLEPKLMQKADAVVCNSFDFTKRAKLFNSNSYYIGNGFDVEQYTKKGNWEIPADLGNIPSPRLGYVGAIINLRLDLNLMIELAKAEPTWSFVFIGWEDEEFSKSELHKMENVFFLGKKHTQEVPAYLDHFDVCLNPQIVNDITRSNFPLKVVEYLALGKPVVATATNTMEELFSDFTYLANDKATYLKSIKDALQENSPELQKERKEFVKKFSWANVASELLKAVEDISNKKNLFHNL